jgi:phage terminase small subunit
MTRKLAIKPPSDLDEEALEKWHELEPRIAASQSQLLANLCRNHWNLVRIREAKAQAVKSGGFEAMIMAKNGSMVPSPYIRAETRLMVLENRMLAALGLGQASELEKLLTYG